MAEGKKSFVLYCDLIHNIEHLTNEEKGVLFQHLLEYVNDKHPILEDRLLFTAWKPIERQLKRDLQSYESKRQERSRSGQLGNLKKYHIDLYEDVKSEKITLKSALAIAESRKASHSDTKLAVNDNDNVNDNVIHLYSERDFLINWNELRQHYLKTPSNLNRLQVSERDLFNDLENNFTKEQYHKSLTGLFKQERVPASIMWFKPKHFLENKETYLDAELNKNYKLYV
mgnify:CR=1 FL=1